MVNKTSSSNIQPRQSAEDLTNFLERFIRHLARASENQLAVTPTDLQLEKLKDVLAALAGSPAPDQPATDQDAAPTAAEMLAPGHRVGLDAARVLGTASQLEELADTLWSMRVESDCIPRALYSAKALRQIVMDTAARNQRDA